jgi:hypothetical protein
MNIFQKKLLFPVLLLSLSLACNKSDVPPLQKLKFNLVVLDENGKKQNVLKEGEDFSIGFEVVNRSRDSVFISNNDGRKLFQQFYKHDDFLSIYRKSNGVDNSQLVYIGKPYDPDIEILIAMINLQGNLVSIGPWGRQYLFLLPWSNNKKNQTIPSGTYFSFYKDTILIEDVEIAIDTEIEFKVN